MENSTNKFFINNKVQFNTTDSGLAHLNNKIGTVIEILSEGNVDIQDVGYMYGVLFESEDAIDGYETIDAFEDELTSV